jgi:hypothetical protein
LADDFEGEAEKRGGGSASNVLEKVLGHGLRRATTDKRQYKNKSEK